MQTTNISTLKINKLTKAQYERERDAGNLDENALYLTPDDGLDASDIASGTISLDRLPVIPPEKGGTGVTSLSGIDVTKVGDTLTTWRTDLGDNWLLCNGADVDLETYPALRGLTSTKYKYDFVPERLWSDIGSVNHTIYANGYYVAVGYHNDGTVGYASLAYSTSPDGPWTKKDLWSANNKYSFYNNLYNIVYVDGLWVVLGNYYVYSTSSSNRFRIAYSTSLDGPWTIETINDITLSAGSSSGHILYANGYWVLQVGSVVINNTNKSGIYYSTSLSGPWTFVDFDFTTNDIKYINGYFIVYGTRYTGSTSDYEGKLAYTTSPDMPWTTKTVDKELGPTYMNRVDYIQGYWYLYGSTANSISARGGRVAYSTSIEGPWNYKPFPNYGEITCINYIGGKYIIAARHYSNSNNPPNRIYISCSDSFEGTWTDAIIWSDREGSGIKDIVPIPGQDNKFLAGGRGADYDGEYLYIPYVVPITIEDYVTLPTISMNSSYTYFKVKE